MMKGFQRFLLAFSISLIVLIPGIGSAQSPLDNCKDQFIDGTVKSAPTIYSSPSDRPYGTNQQLCYRTQGTSFFALEYWPEEFAPRWAAYKLTPEHYGANGCHTFTRKIAGCYFKEKTWAGFLSCQQGPDPFHVDATLPDPKLKPDDFTQTDHDQGHIAPRQAFSWNICGTYQTFTMANMSPQRAYFNQQIWAYLENQVLTWGVQDGPVYVVSGTTFRRFPYQNFQVYNEGVLHADQIYPRHVSMETVVTQTHANYNASQNGDLLRPKRDPIPDKIKDVVKPMHMPTGYFKVIYRPAMNGEPAHAIGFLLPHSYENLTLAANSYSNLTKKESFWLFVSRIDLIEETSGVHFPGIPQAMKSQWGDDWFFAHDKAMKQLHGDSCGRGTPAAVLENSTLEDRLRACTDQSQ